VTGDSPLLRCTVREFVLELQKALTI